jgi:hypothetical protein
MVIAPVVVNDVETLLAALPSITRSLPLIWNSGKFKSIFFGMLGIPYQYDFGLEEVKRNVRQQQHR